MNDLIPELLSSFSLDYYRPIVPRALDLGEPLEPRAGNLVKVVTGMRRSGKSYRLFQEMENLLARGVSSERLCYFNFEDDRLAPVTSEVGDAVLEAFFRLHPSAADQGVYLFLDELQEMEGWGAWLRHVVDTTKATVYVSGSSSKMLSEEISTAFRGRAIDFELLPYSFAEYAAARGAKVPSVTPSSQERRALQSLLDEYLVRGGFPAAVELPNPQAVALLQSYAQRVVSRDVVERHNVSKPRVASLFAQRLLGSNARELSIRKIEGDLRSAGIATSRELLGDLLAYFEQAYLVFTVREFSRALAQGGRRPPKVYAVDPGLAAANARASVDDAGQRLENAVYLELRRRTRGLRRDGVSSHITKGHGYEVDFACGDALFGEVTELYQVNVDVDNERTRRRETRALFEALLETGNSEGTLVVLNGEERTYEQDGVRIRQVPAWKWFAQG